VALVQHLEYYDQFQYHYNSIDKLVIVSFSFYFFVSVTVSSSLGSSISLLMFVFAIGCPSTFYKTQFNFKVYEI